VSAVLSPLCSMTASLFAKERNTILNAERNTTSDIPSENGAHDESIVPGLPRTHPMSRTGFLRIHVNNWDSIGHRVAVVISLLGALLLFGSQALYEIISTGDTGENAGQDSGGDGFGGLAAVFLIQTTITYVVLLAALCGIHVRKGPDDGTRKWAFGALGSIIGFWLKL
jgi:hypothetical protein